MSRTTSLALLGAASLAAAAADFIPVRRFDLSTRDNSTGFVSCLDQANLNPVVQGDAAYANDSAPFNLRLPYKPVALVYPNNAQDVAAALTCASSFSVKANARAGGHSYASYSTGGEDGHLILSLDNLREITVNGDKATIGTGNHISDLALGLFENGERAVAHGTCPYLGVGGHTGHGGFGLPSRAWGLLLDQVYEAEVVLSNGSIVTANTDTNSDLFWAVRGAASSFGVVTSFKFNTQPAPAHNVWFSYGWNNLSAAQASDFTAKWQSFGQDLAAAYGLQIHINPQQGSTPQFVVDGYYYGDDIASVNTTLKTLLDSYGVAPDSTDFQDQTWVEQEVFLAGVKDEAALNTTGTQDGHDTFFADSVFVSENDVLKQPSLDALYEYLWGPLTAANDHLFWFLIFDLYGGKDSFISNVGADDTSFDARDALYSIQLYGSSGTGPYPADGISLVEGVKKSITDNQPETTFKGYANYVSSELSRDEAHKFYYPTHTDKLEKIKAIYDPNDVISFPQSFLPASGY